jgi:hypothetical protein
MLLSRSLAKKRIRPLPPGRDESSLTSARMVSGFGRSLGSNGECKARDRRFRRKFRKSFS